MDIYVCDFDTGVCINCTGGLESLNLRGHKGWNYVICEHIGDYVKMVKRLNDIASSTIGVCEVSVFGIDG